METSTKTSLNLTTGEKLESFLNGRVPHSIMLNDNSNHPLNIIYFGDEEIPKEFIQLSEQFIRPNKYQFLGRTIIPNLLSKELGSKPDPVIMGKVSQLMKKASGRPIVFDLHPLYPTFIQSFNNIPKTKIIEGFDQILNSITQDFNTKAPDRKNVLILSESLLQAENLNRTVLGSTSKITSLIGFIRYLIIFNLTLSVKNLDAIIFYNDKNHLFYPLTLPAVANKVGGIQFNKAILIKLLQDISPKFVDKYLQDDAKEIVTERLQETIPEDKVVVTKLLNNLESLDGNDLSISQREEFVQQLKAVVEKYPGQTLKEKLTYLFKDEAKEAKEVKPKAKGVAAGQGKTIPVEIKKTEASSIQDTIEEINKVYNGSVQYSDIESNMVKQVFDPKDIVGLEEFSSINKQQTEMFEKLDENIRDLANAFTQDPDLNIEVMDIKSKLVETNKDRFIEYNVKIKHDYGIATKKPYTITFRVPAPIDEKYLKVGGNNYIMIQQLFPQPIQKVSNTTARLYTHYNTTSVILKGSVLESKDFKNIEKEFIDNLVSSKTITRSKVQEITQATKTKLIEEYGCPLTMMDLQYNFAF